MIYRYFAALNSGPIRTHIARSALIAAGLLAAGGAAAAAGIEVIDAWARPTPPGVAVGAAYFRIINQGKTDRLVAVSSPIAKRAELHISKMEGGVMTMRPLEAVEVKKGSPVAFMPNGRHVMLMGLKQPLKPGDRVPLVLTFAHAGAVEVQVTVSAAAGGAAMGAQSDHATGHGHSK